MVSCFYSVLARMVYLTYMNSKYKARGRRGGGILNMDLQIGYICIMSSVRRRENERNKNDGRGTDGL